MFFLRCFQWLGGAPELVVPDNLKSATSRTCLHQCHSPNSFMVIRNAAVGRAPPCEPPCRQAAPA
ncbi:hypothetical protein EGH57_18875 [Klebsiella aerogenes]|nr:hypothetical protein EGH57_18875 [Klebsiella aerogenes]